MDKCINWGKKCIINDIWKGSRTRIRPWVNMLQDRRRIRVRGWLHPAERFNFFPPPTRLAISKMFDFGSIVFSPTGPHQLAVNKIPKATKASFIITSKGCLALVISKFELFVDPWRLVGNGRPRLKGKQNIQSRLDHSLKRRCFLLTWLFASYQATIPSSTSPR